MKDIFLLEAKDVFGCHLKIVRMIILTNQHPAHDLDLRA